MTQDNREQLERCIAKHCPEISGDAQRLWAYASMILLNLEKHEQVVGRFSDGKKIATLQKRLGQAVEIMAELSDFTRQRLDRKIPPLTDEADQELFNERLASLCSLQEGVTAFGNSYIARNPPMQGLRSKGTSVAAACMTIWRELNGEDQTPTSPHKTRLGPMGRFTEKVFHILNIGMTVGAAFEAVDRQEPLNLWHVSLELPK